MEGKTRFVLLFLKSQLEAAERRAVLQKPCREGGGAEQGTVTLLASHPKTWHITLESEEMENVKF